MNWIQDAGHGGSDPGAVSHGNIEKVYTLEAALYVDNRLGDHGISSHLTRSSDITVGPNQRTNKVKKYKKCISHHFNAGGGGGAEFIHSVYTDGKFELLLTNEFKKAGYPVRPRTVYSRKNNSGTDYYYMHRETGNCRTTIVEYEFVDGPHAQKIKDKTYREGMYECVVRAICRDEGVTYKPLKKNEPKPKPALPKKEETKEEAFMNEKAIVINRFEDYPVAVRIQKKFGYPIFERSVAEREVVAKEIIIVGGYKGEIKGSKFIDLSGATLFDTVANVENYLK